MDGEEFRFRAVQIYLPLIGLSLLFLACYSALNWLLVVKAALVPLDDDVIDYWLPLIIAAGLAAVFILPRIRLFAPGKKGGIPIYYSMVALAVLAVPVMVAQGYLRTATDTIAHVKNIEAIGAVPASRYYSADVTCLEQKKAAGAGVRQIGGRHNESMDFTIFVVVPVCTTDVLAQGAPSILGGNAPGATAFSIPPVWIGLKFYKSVDSSLSDAAQKKAYSDFAAETEQKVLAESPAHYRYFERLQKRSDRQDFDRALVDRGVPNPAAQIVLVPHAESFEGRAGEWLYWLYWALGAGMVGWLILVMVTPLDDDRVAQWQAGAVSDADGAQKSVLHGVLWPTRASYGLAVLVDINLAVFVVMVIAGLGFLAFAPDDLIVWGGNYGPALQGVGFLRLVSSQFVHGGLMHLLNNMYGLVIAGTFLMPAVNNWRLILCYLICGLGGSIASAVMHPEIVSIGASGAILGLWGMLLALALLKHPAIGDLKKPILTNGVIFIGLTIAMGGFTPGIDNAAHIGGSLTGFVLGCVIALLNMQQKARDAEA